MKTRVLDGLWRIVNWTWSLGPWAAGLIVLLSGPSFVASTAAAAGALPKPQHVFIIVLENKSYDVTFGPKTPALYLNALAREGALLENYYGIGHNSLDNYIAMVSGQAPNHVTQEDCQDFVDFKPTGPLDSDGQAVGAGCIYPANVPTLAGQMQNAKGDTPLNWKGYMEDMGNDPSRESAACGRPTKDKPDSTQRAKKGDQYAARHNPFIYFHELDADCAKHIVNLSQLTKDLEKVETTPNFAFITPNLCHDGHDEPCVDGEPGGLLSADRFLQKYVPQILISPAFKKDGLLIVTFDEAEVYIRKNKLESGDVSACCDEPPGPNTHTGTVFGTHDKGPGILGPGGGRIGAVLLSRYIKEGTVSDVPYNHYSLLRSVEDIFGLKHLGYAGQKGLKSFGEDVFTQSTGSKY